MSAPRRMITVAHAREQAQRAYERHAATWATSAPGAIGDPLLEIPLHPPSQAEALADQAAAIAWVGSWREAAVPGLVWEPRQWASVGTQQVPARIRLGTPEDVAALAHRLTLWRTLARRAAAFGDEWGRSESLSLALRRHARTLVALDENDDARLRGVVRWLVAHPDSGSYIRALPIRGVDSKWVGTHRGVVTGIVGAITGSGGLGLTAPPHLVRVRFLDPALAPGGLRDVSAPVGEIARLPIAPATVFVFENLESVLAMPDLPGAAVVHGSGYAVDVLGAVPWISHGRVLYWGDLDTHGFAILNRIRAHCGDVTPVLMDAATLEAHRDLWVTEATPTTAELTFLTPADQAELAALRAHGAVRLEQERIPWDLALEALRRAAAAGP